MSAAEKTTIMLVSTNRQREKTSSNICRIDRFNLNLFL